MGIEDITHQLTRHKIRNDPNDGLEELRIGVDNPRYRENPHQTPPTEERVRGTVTIDNTLADNTINYGADPCDITNYGVIGYWGS